MAVAFRDFSVAQGHWGGGPAAWLRAAGLHGGAGETRKLREALAASELRLARAEAEAAAQALLRREVDHRAKNTFQTAASMLLLHARRAAEGAKLPLEAAAGRLVMLSRLHDVLHREDAGPGAAVPLRPLLQRLCDGEASAHAASDVVVHLTCPNLALPAERATLVALVVNEAVTNCFKHAFPGGRRGWILVRLEEVEARVRLVVEDDGVGAHESKPGFGSDLMRQLARALGGDLLVQTRPREGMVVTCEFPVA